MSRGFWQSADRRTSSADRRRRPPALRPLQPDVKEDPDRGRLLLPGLQKEVKVVRDENGMAYIHAADENDLIRLTFCYV